MKLLLAVRVCVLPSPSSSFSRRVEEVRGQVDGHGEDDGGVVLGGYAVQRLEVTKLQRKRRGFMYYSIHIAQNRWNSPRDVL